MRSWRRSATGLRGSCSRPPVASVKRLRRCAARSAGSSSSACRTRRPGRVGTRRERPVRRLHTERRPCRRSAMTLKLGDTAPDFEAETTEGRIRFYDWIADSWAVLFSHPYDFTPVCTTELGYLARIQPECGRRGVKVIALSVDPVARHAAWLADIAETQGAALNYPLIGDADF